jgi:hypothetical protein
MSSPGTILLHKTGRVAAIMLCSVLAAQLGCASMPQQTTPAYPTIEFENASQDAVHVFLQVGGGTPFYLNRVDQLSRARLRLPMSNVMVTRLIVVPTGQLGSFRTNGETGGISTEVLNPTDLTSQQWRFTGSLVLAAGPSGKLPGR